MPEGQTPFVSLNPEYLFYLLYLLITGQLFVGGAGQGPTVSGPPEWVVYAEIWWESFALVSLAVSAVLLVVIINLLIRYNRLLRYQDEVLFAPLPPASEPAAKEARSSVAEEEKGEGVAQRKAVVPHPFAPPAVPREAQPASAPSRGGFPLDRLWELEELARSDNPKAWREAVLQAGELLDDVMAQLGVGGLTPQERWRNFQARAPEVAAVFAEVWQRVTELRRHSTDYVLTKREAIQTIDALRRGLRLLREGQ